MNYQEIPFTASVSLFFLFNCKYVHYKILAMTRFETRTSGIGNDRYTD